MRDITERKRVDAALRESANRYAEAQSIAHLGSWEWDLSTQRNIWSDENYRLFGYEPGSVEPDYALWFNRIHPDDQQRVLDHVQAVLDGTIAYEIEYRVVLAEGIVRHLYCLGEVFHDANGKPKRIAGTVLDITERRLAENALRESERRLLDAQSIAHLGSLEWDFQTGRGSWSDELYRLMGYAPGEVAPNYDNWVERIHAEDRSAVQQHFRSVFNSGSNCDIEYRVVYPSGEIRHVHWRGELSRDGNGNELRMTGTLLDISVRKRAEAALRRAYDGLERRVEERTEELQRAVEALSKTEALLQQAIDVANLGVFERDHVAGEVYFSPTLRKILDLDDDRPGKPGDYLSRVHADDRESVSAARQRAHGPNGDGQYSMEHRIIRADGSIGWVMNRSRTCFDGTGDARRPVRTVGAVLDISERKSMENALRQLNQELDHRVAQRTQQLAESQADLRALVGQLTQVEERERRRLAVELHDTLAQSLAVANMYLWRVRELVGSRGEGAAIGEVLSSLDRTVEDSIKYTRSLIAELSPPVLYDLGLPAAFRWLGDQMARHGLRVDVDGPEEDFSIAEGEAVFLFQCVRELLWNVVKHGGTDLAKIAYGRDADGLSLAVVDHGKGFDLHTVRANGDGGNHFGLFSIRERVELRGGRVEINSVPGAGTWVSIAIPTGRKQATAAMVARPDSTPEASAPANSAAVRIVIVDDHKMLRQGLRKVLEEHTGFAVVGEAGDGTEALALARSLEPDVVIMDVNMPTMNGIEATQEIMRARPSTVVIGLSFATEDYIVRAMQAAGAAVCLPKERTVEDISQAILDAMAARKVGRIENGELRMEN